MNQYENIATALPLGFVVTIASCQHSQADEIKNHLPTAKDNRYDGVLSKNHASGQPTRYSLAFFVSDIHPASQAGRIDHTAPLQGNTIISKVSNSLNRYDGVTLQNKIASGRICRAVACVTESGPHHPMIFHSVVSTQKTTQGGSYHG